MIDVTKSINEMTGHPDFTGPFESTSHEAFHAACAAPIGSLNDVDLVRLIVQEAEVEIVVRYLLDRVEADPAVKLDRTLLLTMLIHEIPRQFWAGHKDLQTEAVDLVHRIDKRIPEDIVADAIFFLEMNSDNPPKRGWGGEWLD
ncbi:hypothetical protein [Devosia sp. YR412]|uniref:hypothetical protein n=1 Tax=Devosia sp. YR412 TaxID=1881030 RepID=UPI000B81E7C3|nr:hypothetical protein [Devosia sp. YR412]